MGTVYQRGSIWWIKYYRNKKPIYESTESVKKGDATRLLAKREGEKAEGRIPGVTFDKIRWDELAEAFIRDYKINGKKSLPKAERSVRHLKKHFGGMRVTDINSSMIGEFTDARLEEGAANATVNRELAALKRMLNLGRRAGKVNVMPYIAMLEENNVREGFLEPGKFMVLRDALPDHLKGITTIAYRYGFRRGELLELTWDKVSLKNGTIRLERGDTKSKKGRTIVLDPECKELLIKQRNLAKDTGHISNFVFLNDQGTGPLRDFRGAWDKACKEVGLQGCLYHDFRRSAVRNMVRGGTSEKVAMKISGHRTRSVFDRYDIVSEDDLKDAALKIAAYNEAEGRDRTVVPFDFARKKKSKKTA